MIYFYVIVCLLRHAIPSSESQYCNRIQRFHLGNAYPGVVSRGAQGGGAPLLKSLIILGASAPLKILALTLLFKVY